MPSLYIFQSIYGKINQSNQRNVYFKTKSFQIRDKIRKTTNNYRKINILISKTAFGAKYRSKILLKLKGQTKKVLRFLISG